MLRPLIVNVIVYSYYIDAFLVPATRCSARQDCPPQIDFDGKPGLRPRSLGLVSPAMTLIIGSMWQI